MSSLTTNLKLVKPELQDNITPTIFADNFDKIDAALEGVSGGALSLEEIEASTNLDGKIPSAAALKEVNNSLSNLGKATLLASPNANGTVTVSNLSVFKYIYIEIGWTGTNLIFDPSVIPYDVFKNGNKYNLQALVASASYKASNHATFQYISDTSISVELMDSANIRPKIYGIK